MAMKRRRNGLASRPIFLLVLVFLISCMLVNQVAAQDDDLPDITSEKDSKSTPAKESASKPSKTDKPSSKATEPPSLTSEASKTKESDSSKESTEKSTKTSESESSKTATSTESTDTSMPTLPELPGQKIPTPTIPPKEGAPYLKQSKLPEGTIFIVVGAALGLVGLGVVAWRVLVAWSINRSVRRAAANQHQGDATTLLNPNKRKSGALRHTGGASMSMEKIGHNRHSAAPGTHRPTSNLFFSPTAGTSMQTPGNRGSGYLPAGYYSASSATPGGGSGLAHLSSSSIGLSNLGPGPQAQGYSRTRSVGPSPPGSPGLPPNSRGPEPTHHPSTSSLNLNAPPQGRAPSAYLEDLFENHPPGHPAGRAM